MITEPLVVSGSASFAYDGDVFVVTQDSTDLVIDWETFRIGAGETVRFVQPSAASTVLNRVAGSDQIVIEGPLTSNGKVWLVSPTDVVIDGAVIDAAEFVVTVGVVETTGSIHLSGGSPTLIDWHGMEATGEISITGGSIVPSGTLLLVPGVTINLDANFGTLTGADTMEGANGNDLFIADRTYDRIVELADAGIDTVIARTNYALPNNVENLVLHASVTLRGPHTGFFHGHHRKGPIDLNIDGTGNAGDNLLVGNRAANRLLGGDGEDRLIGGGGNDLLNGGRAGMTCSSAEPERTPSSSTPWTASTGLPTLAPAT